VPSWRQSLERPATALIWYDIVQGSTCAVGGSMVGRGTLLKASPRVTPILPRRFVFCTDPVAGSDASSRPVDAVPGAIESGLVLLCDHASNALPPEYGDLGLPPEAFARHIAYDIGAAEVTRGLARGLRAPALLTTWSRLLLDPNRGRDDPTLVMRLSDGQIVPGNRHVDEAEIERRLQRFYDPYDAAITAELDRFAAAGVVPIVVSMHSFTPAWKGVPRPWHVGLLTDRDYRVTTPLLVALKADPLLVVGDNEPYDGALAGDTLHRHATRRGLPNTLVEIRQDLIADKAGVAAWVERLVPMLAALAADTTLRRVEYWGSRTDRTAGQG
jgi:predicted N-formylglutamate amidohydrolase